MAQIRAVVSDLNDGVQVFECDAVGLTTELSEYENENMHLYADRAARHSIRLVGDDVIVTMFADNEEDYLEMRKSAEEWLEQFGG